ncbi:MAG: OmpH family outer membrane protein [Candidatus Omnitrophota bacterium]|nr:OmpH family outer membrane protein [Candidatus Omnitrophota bacterium]
MKTLLTILLITLSTVLMATPTAHAAAEPNYAYVDVAKIFDEYEKTKTNDTALQTAGQEKEKDREKMVKDIRALKDELVLLADDAKVKKQEVLDEKIRELQDFDRDARRDLGKQRNDLVRDIFQDIDEVVKRYGERKGFDLIFNERALLYRHDKFDITQDVLKELNKSYGKKQ